MDVTEYNKLKSPAIAGHQPTLRQEMEVELINDVELTIKDQAVIVFEGKLKV